LSIMAEIVQQRRNAEQLDWTMYQNGSDEPSATAIDPICQMEVEIATAVYQSEIDGELFYFCCAGCQEKFERHSRQS